MASRTFLWVSTCCLLVPAVVSATAPVAVSPGSSNGIARLSDRCPTFSWSAVEAATAYELVVVTVDGEASRGPDSPGRFEIAGTPEVSVAIHGPAIAWTPAVEQCLEAGGRFAWSVRAVFGEAPGPWAEAQIFEVGLGPSDELEVAIERVLERLLQTRGLVAVRTGETSASAPVERTRVGDSKGGLQAAAQARPLSAISAGTDAALYASLPGAPGIPDYGVHGMTASSATGSAGLVGEAAAGAGTTRGVIGSVASGAGIGGLFENTAGGKILSASDGAAEVFSVDASGVTADSATVHSGWITGALQFDGGGLLLGSGTDAKPSLRWMAELDTGFNATSTSIDVVTSGAKRMSVGDDMLATSRPLQTGVLFPVVGYNRFGNIAASRPNITNVDDLLVADDVEVRDDLWVGGSLTAGSLSAPHTHPGGDITGTVSNADTVDGQHASSFAEDGHHHLGETWTTGSAGLSVRTSETSFAAALEGVATDTGTGSARGVLGKASSTSGIGVFGWSTNATHGIGVKAYSQGSAYPAAFFVNDGSGPLLVANSSDTVVNPKFIVSSSGDLTIEGELTGSGAGGGEITSTCGKFVAVTFCPAGQNDGPACDSVAAGGYCEYDGSVCTNLDSNLDNCPGLYDWYLRTE